MKKQALLFFALSICAFGQGVRYDVPPILNSRAVLVPNANISLCPGTATITNSTCSPASTQAFTDITLTTPCATGSPVVLPQTNVCSGVADALGNAGFWLAPGAYIYCINGPTITGKCYNLTVPVGTTTIYPAAFTITAVQSCVTAAAAFTNGGRCLIPTGTYIGTTTLAIPANVVVECDGWDAILQWTGSTTPAISMGNNSVLRNCKQDTSGGTMLASISITGNDVLLDHNWILGAATDAQTTHDILVSGARVHSQQNQFDTLSLFKILGTDGFQSYGDRFVNYRTGFWLFASGGVQNTNALFVGTHCVSVAGSGLIQGMDCFLIGNSQHITLIGTKVAASREHGIYMAGPDSLSVPAEDLKVIGATLTNIAQMGIHALSNTNNSTLYTRDVQLTDITCSLGPISSGTALCAQFDEIISGQMTNIHAVAAPGVAGLNKGIEIDGPVSDSTITNTVCVDVTGPCVFMRDFTLAGAVVGSLNRITVTGTKGLNGSFGSVSGFGCVVLQPDNGGVVGGANTNTDLHFFNNDCNDTQGTHTQRSTVQLVTPTNGSAVNRVDVTGTTGIGNTQGSIEGGSGYTNYAHMEPDQAGDYRIGAPFFFLEQGAPVGGGPGSDGCYGDSTAHAILCNYNNANTFTPLVKALGSTSQKAETGSADANVLTYTPPATVGTYRACFNASVSSATAGVIAWTLSYKNSNAVAQTNDAMPLTQQNTAAPNTTFTTSAAGEYQGCWTFDIDNSATAIVVKWVGGGTTAAKVSATVERLI